MTRRVLDWTYDEQNGWHNEEDDPAMDTEIRLIEQIERLTTELEDLRRPPLFIDDTTGAHPGVWVAFDNAGFPYGFLNAICAASIIAAASEFADAARLELVTDDNERRRLLDIHTGTNT